MSPRTWISLLTVLVGVQPQVHSQDVEFEHLSALPDPAIESIVQDETGFIWIGTWTGLYRYDGYEFKRFGSVDGDTRSLSGEKIRRLCVDREGVLWVATAFFGLNRYDPETESFTRFTHDPVDPNSLSSDEVRSLYVDSAGTLWAGTGDGLNRFDRRNGRFDHFRHDPQDPKSLSDSRTEAIVEDRTGSLWIATYGGGLNRMVSGDAESSTFVRYRHHPDDAKSLSHDVVLALSVDRSGSLWVGTWGGGLDRFDHDTERFHHYRHDPRDPGTMPSNRVLGVHEDRAGVLWISTAEGLATLDRVTERFTRYTNDPEDPGSLPGNFVHNSVFEDATGSLWVPTLESLAVRHPGKRLFAHHRHDPDDLNSVPSNSIMTIASDRAGHIWIGTLGGVSRLEPDTWTFTLYGHDPVAAIVEGQDGAIWAGTMGGLNELNPVSGSVVSYRHAPENPHTLSDDTIIALGTDESGAVWVGTGGGGLNRLDPLTGRVVRIPRSETDTGDSLANKIFAIRQDRHHDLWFAGQSTLIRRVHETGRFVQYAHDPSDPDSLGPGEVMSIYEDRQGTLWIGTDRLNQLVKRQKEDDVRFIRHSSEAGLDIDHVGSMLEDDEGNLWISTLRAGLFRFNPKSRSLIGFDQSDGLQSLSFTHRGAAKARDGRMFFGGPNGFNVFDPAKIELNTHVPPVVITDFQINRQSVPVGDGSPLERSIVHTRALTVAHEDRVLSFEFAALDFRAPGRHRYRYLLEGFEKDWNETDATQRVATYTNLDPGDYVFRVIGSNNHQVWNEEGAAIRLTVTPPWWQTSWFRVLALSAFVGLLFSIHQLRMKYVVETYRRLEEEIVERTVAETELRELGRRMVSAQEDDRARIARELHDDVSQRLAMATIRIDLANSTLTNAPDETSQRLADLRTLVEQVSKDVRQVAHELHPKTLEQLGIGTALEVLCEQLQQRTETTIRASLASSLEQISPEAALCLFRISQEALRNVVKHAEASEAELDLSVSNGLARLRVTDNGVGFDPRSQKSGLGLASIRERARLLGGVVELDSEPGAGTQLTVEIPVEAQA